MLKKITILMVIGINLTYADNIQTVNTLESQNQVLALKLEATQLKKKIIEMEKIIEQDKLKKEKEAKHVSAIAKFRSELRASRNRSNRTSLDHTPYR